MNLTRSTGAELCLNLYKTNSTCQKVIFCKGNTISSNFKLKKNSYSLMLFKYLVMKSIFVAIHKNNTPHKYALSI